MDETGFDNVQWTEDKSLSRWGIRKFGFSFDYEAHGAVDIDELVKLFREIVESRVPVKEVDKKA